MTKQATEKSKSQSAIFRKAARDLGCDESEAAFDAALGKIARHRPKPDKAELDKQIETENDEAAN